MRARLRRLRLVGWIFFFFLSFWRKTKEAEAGEEERKEEDKRIRGSAGGECWNRLPLVRRGELSLSCTLVPPCLSCGGWKWETGE